MKDLSELIQTLVAFDSAHAFFAAGLFAIVVALRYNGPESTFVQPLIESYKRTIANCYVLLKYRKVSHPTLLLLTAVTVRE